MIPNLITMMRAQAMMGRAMPGDEMDDGVNSPGMQAADANAAMPVGLARQASPVLSHKDDTESEPLDKTSQAPVAESHVGDVRTADVGDFGLDSAGGNQTPPKDRPGDAESDKPGEPGSDDIHSTLSALIKNASMEGPSVAAYREMLTKMPTRDKNGPKAIDRIGAALSGISAGWFHPGSGFRIAQQQVEAPYAEAMNDYQQKLKDLAVGANLEQSGKNKLAALAGTMTYRDLLSQNRDAALKLGQGRLDEAKRAHEEGEAIRRGNAETAKQAAIDREKDRALTRAEIAQRDAESRRLHDAQIASITEQTNVRKQQEQNQQEQQTDSDVVSQAKSLGFSVPQDDKGHDLYSPGTADDAASYLVGKRAMDNPSFSDMLEEQTDAKGLKRIGFKEGTTPGQRSAFGAYVYNEKKKLRPHAYLKAK